VRRVQAFGAALAPLGTVCAFESVPIQLLIGALPHGIYRYYHILVCKCARKAESVVTFGLSVIQPLDKQTAFLLEKRRGWLFSFFFFFSTFCFGLRLLGIFLFFKV